MATSICWFYQDLRLADNLALTAAVDSRHGVLPLYVLDDDALDDDGAGEWAIGGASRWWLHHSLTALDKSLAERGSRLIIRRGKAAAIIPALMAEVDGAGLYTARRREEWSKKQLANVAQALARQKIPVKTFGGATIAEAAEIRSKTGTRLRVYTPYKRNFLLQKPAAQPLPVPQSIPRPKEWPVSLKVEDLSLRPKRPDWSGGLAATWDCGEIIANKRWQKFIKTPIDDYDISRDCPSDDATSRLSPHLHFGEISPMTIYYSVLKRQDKKNIGQNIGAEKFLDEVIWREFAYELLDHFPTMPWRPLREEFTRFPYRDDFASDLKAWQRGETGYPLVDAGMRQLYQTGWMHNRVRMVAASFLIKHLLIPWQCGARWFYDTLVDADLASNSAGWQWVAGCGVDASPYFRIFNPMTQAEKFNAGGYIRRFCPELSGLDDKEITAPFAVPKALLAAKNIRLGHDYPLPIIDHKRARNRALMALDTIKAPKRG